MQIKKIILLFSLLVVILPYNTYSVQNKEKESIEPCKSCRRPAAVRMKEQQDRKIYQDRILREKRVKLITKSLLEDEVFVKQAQYGFILGSRCNDLRKATEEVPVSVWDKAIGLIRDNMIIIHVEGDCGRINNDSLRKVCNVIYKKKDKDSLSGWEEFLYEGFLGKEFTNPDDQEKYLYDSGYTEGLPPEVIECTMLELRALRSNVREEDNIEYYKEMFYKYPSLYLSWLAGTSMRRAKYGIEYREVLSTDLDSGGKFGEVLEEIAYGLALFAVAKKDGDTELCSDLAIELSSLCKDNNVELEKIAILGDIANRVYSMPAASYKDKPEDTAEHKKEKNNSL